MIGVVRSRARDLTAAGAAAGAVTLGAFEARRGALRTVEARIFATVNSLSERGRRPAWAIMQLGSLGGSLATGVAVGASGRPRLGRRLATVGALAWAGSKLIKPCARRGRPANVVDETRVLGREQSGLGYPSGHAAVAFAMAGAIGPHLARRWRCPLWATATTVGLTRIYVGAHLPLDVAGGIALGVATERSVRAVRGPA